MTSVARKAFDYIEAHDINGVHTEILLHKFANKYLLIITQYEKLNNVFVACNDIVFSGLMENRSLHLKHQFGMTTDEIECGIRYLLAKINLKTFKNEFDVIICLGLKKYNAAILKLIEGILNKLDEKI